jgi:hypothetical protein
MQTWLCSLTGNTARNSTYAKCPCWLYITLCYPIIQNGNIESLLFQLWWLSFCNDLWLYLGHSAKNRESGIWLKICKVIAIPETEILHSRSLPIFSRLRIIGKNIGRNWVPIIPDNSRFFPTCQSLPIIPNFSREARQTMESHLVESCFIFEVFPWNAKFPTFCGVSPVHMLWWLSK